MTHRDTYSAVDLSANPRPQIGVAAAGRPVYDSYHPAALSIANWISWLTSEEGPYNQHIPLPHGMSLGMNRAREQLQSALGEFQTPTSLRNSAIDCF